MDPGNHIQVNIVLIRPCRSITLWLFGFQMLMHQYLQCNLFRILYPNCYNYWTWNITHWMSFQNELYISGSAIINNLHGDCSWWILTLWTLGLQATNVFLLNHEFRLSETKQSWFCNCAPLRMFKSLDLRLEYWIGHVTTVIFHAELIFSTRIFNMGVPGLPNDCTCGAAD